MIDLRTQYYQVGSEKFANKMLAVLKGAEMKLPVKWIFHDDLWDAFGKTNLHLLGKNNLDYLYAQRAQQLRDSYDYLILHYSGGSDSHNILMTFLNNNIPLDEIYVRRSEKVDSKLYTPNTVDTSAKNILSEWDFVIKPQLNYIRQYYPNIKITLGDQFLLDPDKLYNDNDMIHKVGQFSGWVEIGRTSLVAESDIKLSDKGKRVGNIYGVDKPLVIIKDNKFYMFFTDQAVDCANLTTSIHSNNELFYYAKDMPILPYEQAHAMYKYFLLNKTQRDIIDLAKIKRNDHQRWKMVFEITKKIIYTTWDHNKFQVDKPEPISYGLRTRDLLYQNHPELSPWRVKYQYHVKHWYDKVSTTENFDINAHHSKISVSKLHYIGDMND